MASRVALGSVFYLGLLVGLLIFGDQLLDDIAFLDFLTPYKQYLRVAGVAVLGWLAIGSGSRWVFLIASIYSSTATAGALRIIFRIGALGTILSILLALFTENSAAALTIGSFGGLVAGFATQTVLGNAVAGLFLALGRPFNIGDEATVAGNSGMVMDITLMHTILAVEDREILIPSSNIAGSIIVRHKKPEE